VPLLELGRNISGLNAKKYIRIPVLWIRFQLGSLDPYPDPGGQKLPTNIEKKSLFLKYWMFSFQGWRLLL
jgi:hypothetical protein